MDRATGCDTEQSGITCGRGRDDPPYSVVFATPSSAARFLSQRDDVYDADRRCRRSFDLRVVAVAQERITDLVGFGQHRHRDKNWRLPVEPIRVRVPSLRQGITGIVWDYGDSLLNPQLNADACQRQRHNATIAAPSAPASYSASYATISCQAGRGLVLFFRNLTSPFAPLMGERDTLCQRRDARTAKRRNEKGSQAIENKQCSENGETKSGLSH